MKILVVGSGGREHALAWKFASSEYVSHVYVAPGNGGTDQEPGCSNVDLDVLDFPKMKAFILDSGVDLVVVGPEQPLVQGITDALYKVVPVFGPTARLAALEGSKTYAKILMENHDIPTPRWIGISNIKDADHVLTEAASRFRGGLRRGRVVVKADGLASGKGVAVCSNEEEAMTALRTHLCDRKFGTSSELVLVEEVVPGWECSFIVIADGESYVILPPTQDYKRRSEGDKGPNTGGMGARSMLHLDSWLAEETETKVVQPTLKALGNYRGFLYVGLMVDKDGPNVLEYNVRGGDPETQAIMASLDYDLVPYIYAAACGKLDVFLENQEEAELPCTPSVCVVAVDHSYPEGKAYGQAITGIEEADRLPGVKVFHGGTAQKEGETLAIGGRVLSVTSRSDSDSSAKENAYIGMGHIKFHWMDFRKDIGVG